MPLQITGRHVEVSPEDRDYLEKKVPRVRRLFERIDEFAVVFLTEKRDHVVEINFRAGQFHLFTKGSGSTAKAAIDKAMDKLLAQASKARDRKFGNKIHAGETIRAANEVEEPEAGEASA